MEKNNFQQKQELERQKLIMVELPNLIQRILHLSMIPCPISEEIVKLNISEIKKITNAECEATLSYLEKLIKS
jgi:hypothetical protein|nr:MAG TPA: hypothetical protein [Caudoviricetes sp.]